MSAVTAALEELGMSFSIRDDEAVMLCPYHDDHRAGNFSVNINTGQNHCFSCGGGGWMQHVVTSLTGWTYFRANRWWLERRGTQSYYDHSEAEPASTLIDTSQQINEASLALFTAPPKEVMEHRRITAEAAGKHGLLWDAGNWIIPIRSPNNHQLLGWQEKGEYSRFFKNYPTGIEKSKTLFGYAHLPNSGTAVLVESPLDVVRLEAAGIVGAVSSYGVQVSDYQLDLLCRRARCLVLALDNDYAGMAKTEQICTEFSRLPVSVFNYGAFDVKDPGDMADWQVLWSMTHRMTWREIQEIMC